MKILDCVQGTPEWHEARRTYYRTASSASAMMGASPYQTRADLIRRVATGIEQDHDDATKARFAKGHEIEAMARPMAEEIVGEALYPVTATTDDGYLLASFDGLTMGEDVACECKSWNEDKVRRMLADGLVPLEDRYQVMQQLAVMGSTSRVLYMVTDGTLDNCECLWMVASGNEYATLAPHWAQFDLDVMNYQHVESAQALVGEVLSELPSVFVQVEGRVVAGDMRAHRATVSKWVQALPSVFETDQDFVNGAQAVKDCANAEASLAALLQQVLGQMVEVDEVIRLINESKAEIAAARLRIDKLVKSEKENRRAALVMAAHEEIRQHRDALNKRIGGAWMPITPHPFGDVVKGLKSLKSMEDKLATAIAQAKVAESAMADRIQANREALLAADRGLSDLTDGLEGNARKLAILQISPELLRELFQLPDGAEVLDLRVPIDYRGLLEVKIAGAGWPTLEGQAIMRTVGTVTREFDAGGAEVRRSIDWRLPSNMEFRPGLEAKPEGIAPGTQG